MQRPEVDKEEARVDDDEYDDHDGNDDEDDDHCIDYSSILIQK